MASRDLYVATRSAHVVIDGVRTLIRANKTYARAGHEILKRFPNMFKKVEPEYETTSKSRSRVSEDAELLTPKTEEPKDEDTE